MSLLRLITFRKQQSKPVWTPAQIPTALWLDASDNSTITLNGSNVSQWNDKSGNGYHVSQQAVAKQPPYGVLANQQNNLNTISFDGINDELRRNTEIIGNASSQKHIFLAGKWLSSAVEDIPIAIGGTADNHLKMRCFYRTTNSTTFGLEIFNGGVAEPSFNPINGNFNTFYGRFPVPNSNTYEIGYNGTIVSKTGPFPQPIQAGVIVGGWQTVAPYFTAINVGEIIICDALTVSDRQKIEGYLAHKWGLTANLPAGHPYKTIPPYV